MLRYSTKLNNETELNNFPIYQLYVSPDLTYISGETDYNIGLIDGEDAIIRSPYLIGSDKAIINVNNVRRQGYVGINIGLPVKTITKKLKLPVYSDDNGNYVIVNNKKEYISNVDGDSVLMDVSQKYVEYKGDICYFFNGGYNSSGYLINQKFYNVTDIYTGVIIEEYVPIEDDKLHIGNYIYDVDFSKVTNDNDIKPEIKLNKYSVPVTAGTEIGIIDGCEYSFMGDEEDELVITDYKPSEWKRVTKFFISKSENPSLYPEDVLYGGYKHFVTYNNENYYVNDVYDNEEYIGYGVTINGKFYSVTNNYGNDIHDVQYGGSAIYIEDTDEYLGVTDTLVSPTNGGKFVLFIDLNEHDDIQNGNVIKAESNCPLTVSKLIQYDNEETLSFPYIIYRGLKYYIENHLFDEVILSGEKYRLVYENDDYSSAKTYVNGDILYFTINGDRAILNDNIYYKSSGDNDKNVLITYGKNENGYQILRNSGVTIGDRIYLVDSDSVFIEETIKINLLVNDVNGASTYICYPIVDENLNDTIADRTQRELSATLVENWKSFNFTLKKDTFGEKEFTPENYLMESITSTKPYTASEGNLLQNKIEILRVRNYASFKFPLINKTGNNLMRDDIIKNSFVDYIKERSINNIVDMEKDVYYPTWKTNDSNNNVVYKPIQTIRFNLHFRTRNLENWKVIEDDREFADDITPNSEMCNWFVTDYNYYKWMNSIQVEGSEYGNKYLHNASDLLGYINFTTEDVRNTASKLSKSFLRLSFYSTDNPNTQVLLSTATVFFDVNKAFRKYTMSKRNSDLIYLDTNYIQVSNCENLKTCLDSTDYQISSNTISVFSEVLNMETLNGDVYFNDSIRLSSRFEIKDKYNSEKSSEGYYLYMFKEYSKKMREATIYLKVEFNHAGIGKSIPFMLPRSKKGGEIEYPLYIHNKIGSQISKSDLDLLKEGFSTKDIYKQTYIPINIIYDDRENRYVYYLPDSLRENETLEVSDDIMEFNLFEVKFSNESISEQKRFNEDESNQ